MNNENNTRKADKNWLGGEQQKNLILVGLIFDANLGDQAIYQSARAMINSVLNRNNFDYEIKTIDLYGRNKPDIFKKKSVLQRINKKIKRKIFHINQEAELFRQIVEICEKTFDSNTAGVIFVGGGLLKYSHQIISEPMQIVLQYAKDRDIPVMLSAVGIEGYDKHDTSCTALAEAINTENIKIITTRDNIELLREKWLKRDEILTDRVADPACALAKYFPCPSVEKREKIIGLGIGRSDLFEDYGFSFSPLQAKKLWITIYKKLSERGYKCVLFTNGLHADYEFALEILKEIHQEGYPKAICLEEPRTIEQLVGNISSFRGMIVTRLHASIIGFSYDVPNIGLVWNEKQHMFGKNIGYPERFIYPDSFDEEVIADALERAIAAGYKKINKEDYIKTTEVMIEKFINMIS